MEVKFLSMNVRGLNTPEKRSYLMQELHGLTAQIVYLQETHFKTDSVPSIYSKRFHIAYHDTNPKAKLKGVTTLIAKELPF